MKTHLLLLAGLVAPAILLFSGCSGGGGQPDPDPQPGAAGQGFNPAAIDAALHVGCKGQVLQTLANGHNVPLSGVAISVMSGGVNVDNAVTDRNGVYRVRLRRGQHNAVRASRIGFNFDPPVLLATSRSPEVLPNIVGSAAGGLPGGPNLGAGRVTVRFFGNPASNPLDNASIEIRNMADNRVLQNITLLGRSEISFAPRVGMDLLITPSGRGVLSWQPESRQLRVTPDEQIISFGWPDQIIRAPAPTPRPVLKPFPRPTPRPSLSPTAPRPQPTPTPIARPLRYPIGQP